jgi:hypothetical protein
MVYVYQSNNSLLKNRILQLYFFFLIFPKYSESFSPDIPTVKREWPYIRAFTVQFFKNIFIAQTVYTTRVRTSYKIVPLTNLNEYLHNEISVMEVNLYVSVNNSSEKTIQKTLRLLFSQLNYRCLCCVPYV